MLQESALTRLNWIHMKHKWNTRETQISNGSLWNTLIWCLPQVSEAPSGSTEVREGMWRFPLFDLNNITEHFCLSVVCMCVLKIFSWSPPGNLRRPVSNTAGRLAFVFHSLRCVIFSKFSRGGVVMFSKFFFVLQTLFNNQVMGDVAPTVSLHCFLFCEMLKTHEDTFNSCRSVLETWIEFLSWIDQTICLLQKGGQMVQTVFAKVVIPSHSIQMVQRKKTQSARVRTCTQRAGFFSLFSVRGQIRVNQNKAGTERQVRAPLLTSFGFGKFLFDWFFTEWSRIGVSSPTKVPNTAAPPVRGALYGWNHLVVRVVESCRKSVSVSGVSTSIAGVRRHLSKDNGNRSIDDWVRRYL